MFLFVQRIEEGLRCRKRLARPFWSTICTRRACRKSFCAQQVTYINHYPTPAGVFMSFWHKRQQPTDAAWTYIRRLKGEKYYWTRWTRLTYLRTPTCHVCRVTERHDVPVTLPVYRPNVKLSWWINGRFYEEKPEWNCKLCYVHFVVFYEIFLRQKICQRWNDHLIW